MKTLTLLPFAEHELFEYLLIAHPSQEVCNKVMEEKQNFYDQYHEKIAVNTLPHTTIASFLAKENMEETLVRWMQRNFSMHESFDVTLNNYSGFPPHTIYLRVQDAEPFKRLTRKLKIINEYISSCSCPPARLISNPHLTIARNFPGEVYFKALTRYAHKSFHESFVVSELHLLRRRHQYDNCKTIYVFGLQAMNELVN
jgi:2'-5' RNA ligase